MNKYKNEYEELWQEEVNAVFSLDLLNKCTMCGEQMKDFIIGAEFFTCKSDDSNIVIKGYRKDGQVLIADVSQDESV